MILIVRTRTPLTAIRSFLQIVITLLHGLSTPSIGASGQYRIKSWVTRPGRWRLVAMLKMDITSYVIISLQRIGFAHTPLKIQILETQITHKLELESMQDTPQYGVDYVKTAEATHSYPVTRILWEPASSKKQSTDLLATSGDHLRLWSLPSQSTFTASNSVGKPPSSNQPPPAKLTPLALLSNSKSPEHTAPLTSLDWNTVSPSLIITSSIDTTCTIWDIPTLTAKTQLIAHDKEVFDVRFCANSVDVFVSCGADGSVRMFDLRSLEHSTIIYEPSEKSGESKCTSPFYLPYPELL